MHHEQPTGTHPMMHSEAMPEIWEILTEEQKKKGNYSASPKPVG